MKNCKRLILPGSAANKKSPCDKQCSMPHNFSALNTNKMQSVDSIR